MNNLSRRSLIRGAAVLPAAGLGLVSTADASSSSKPKFDEIYDVVIIGSGFPGLLQPWQHAKRELQLPY